MVHSLISPAAAAATPFSANTRRTKNPKCLHSAGFQTVWPSSSSSDDDDDDQYQPKSSSNHNSLRLNVPRRNVTLGLMGAVLGLGVENGSAMAAGRRPPPPPPTEKKDPNISGALAKVLANKKRKEEMKEAIAKLRAKGKPVNQSIEIKD